MSIKVPFVDLRSQHEEVRSEIERAITDILDNSSFIGGSHVAKFESEFADYIGVKEAVGVANGTDALWLALNSVGVGTGDMVITVPNTFIATVESISRCGATPVFVDIDLKTANIDVDKTKEFLERDCIRDDEGNLRHKASGCRLIAILVVHLYGLPANIEPLSNLAKEYGLILVEDACQAHGARYLYQGNWLRSGSVGQCAAFSFYPGKNLGAIGDAGAVVTNDVGLADEMRCIRDHGSTKKYIHKTSQGWNTRLDSIQAAVLSIKLRKLDEWNSRRQKIAQFYGEALNKLPLELPYEPPYAEHVYHLYVVRTDNREILREELASKGIGVSMHYPIPLHLQQAYQHLSLPKGSFPNAELSAATLLSLPMHPAMTEEHVKHVAEVCSESSLFIDRFPISSH